MKASFPLLQRRTASLRSARAHVGWLQAFVIIALFVAALALCLHNLAVQPLWLDEGWTWSIVTSSSWGILVRDLFRPSQAYPLFHLLLKPFTLVSDTEWWLRFPAAVIGALAIPALYMLGRELRGVVLGLGASLLLLVSQFALRQAQDTKAYSLMLLITILLAWTLVRAMRRGTRRDWLGVVGCAITSVFVHRLLVFTLLGCVVAWVLVTQYKHRWWALVGAAVAGAVLVAGLAWAQDYVQATAQFPDVNPVRAAWRTFVKFSTGLCIRQLRLEWLIVFLLLATSGGGRMVWDVWQGRYRRSAVIVLACAVVPALLFSAILLLRPFYVTRYWTALLPFYLLILTWAVPERSAWRWPRERVWGVAALVLWSGAWVSSAQSLVVYPHGLFSGAIVKEEYREAVGYLVDHVQPTDLVIVHPEYIRFMYDYYGARTGNALPAPKVYPLIGREPKYIAQSFTNEFTTDLANRSRAWLLIGPPHASTVDPPQNGADLGWVGTAFQRGGIDGWQQCRADPFQSFLDVRVYCIERAE